MICVHSELCLGALANHIRQADEDELLGAMTCLGFCKLLHMTWSQVFPAWQPCMRPVLSPWSQVVHARTADAMPGAMTHLGFLKLLHASRHTHHGLQIAQQTHNVAQCDAPAPLQRSARCSISDAASGLSRKRDYCCGLHKIRPDFLTKFPASSHQGSATIFQAHSARMILRQIWVIIPSSLMLSRQPARLHKCWNKLPKASTAMLVPLVGSPAAVDAATANLVVPWPLSMTSAKSPPISTPHSQMS